MHHLISPFAKSDTMTGICTELEEYNFVLAPPRIVFRKAVGTYSLVRIPAFVYSTIIHYNCTVPPGTSFRENRYHKQKYPCGTPRIAFPKSDTMTTYGRGSVRSWKNTCTTSYRFSEKRYDANVRWGICTELEQYNFVLEPPRIAFRKAVGTYSLVQNAFSTVPVPFEMDAGTHSNLDTNVHPPSPNYYPHRKKQSIFTQYTIRICRK